MTYHENEPMDNMTTVDYFRFAWKHRIVYYLPDYGDGEMSPVDPAKTGYYSLYKRKDDPRLYQKIVPEWYAIARVVDWGE